MLTHAVSVNINNKTCDILNEAGSFLVWIRVVKGYTEECVDLKELRSDKTFKCAIFLSFYVIIVNTTLISSICKMSKQSCHNVYNI